MAFRTFSEAVRSKTFIGQMIMTLLINFGVNFGLEWATLSEWGKHQPPQWPSLAMWRWNHEVNSCLALDMSLTSFFLGFFCMLLATGGTQKEVKERKCDVLDARVTAGGWWRFTPVRVKNLCARSFFTGLQAFAVIGIPSILLVWAGLGSGEWSGLGYCIFKGFWAMVLAAPTYVLVFFSAIVETEFPELEFEALMLQQAKAKLEAGGEVPMVGAVDKVAQAWG